MSRYLCKQDKAYGSSDIHEMDQGIGSYGDYLLGALVLGCICYVSIWGAPSFVVQRVEQALMEKAFPST